MEAFLLGQEPSLTRVQVAERAGVRLDLAVTLWHQMGFAHHGDDDVAFVESDVEALRLSADLVEIGILPPESQAALVRTWGRSYARVAEWQTTLLAGLAVEGGDPAATLTDLATDVLPRVEALQSYVWRRHLASAAQHLLADADSLARTETELSVCFVDIVGYTAQSRSLDGAELVAWVDRSEQDTVAGQAALGRVSIARRDAGPGLVRSRPPTQRQRPSRGLTGRADVGARSLLTGETTTTGH